jgi:MoxR-like ATPase
LLALAVAFVQRNFTLFKSSVSLNALLAGRLAATRADVMALAPPVMRHRILLSFAAEAERKTTDDVIAALLAALPPPARD